MEQLGADTMLVCSSRRPDAVDDDDLAAEQLHVLADRAAERGLRIAYEALAWGRFVDTYDARLADRRGAPTIPRSACAWTASTCSPAATTRPGSGRSPARSCSSCSSPTRRAGHGRRCSGAGITGCFPGQGSFDLAGVRRPRAGHRLRAGRCRSRCSTTCSGRPTRGRTRSTRCARCSRCRRRSGSARSVNRDLPPAPALRRPRVHRAGRRRRLRPGRPHARRARLRSTPVSTAPSRCSCGSRATARVLLNCTPRATAGRGAAAIARIGGGERRPARLGSARRGAARPGPAPQPRPGRGGADSVAAPDGTPSSSAAPAPTTAGWPTSPRPTTPRRRPRASSPGPTTSR